jgi:transposase
MDGNEASTNCRNCQRLWEALDALQTQFAQLKRRVTQQEEQIANLEAENQKLAAENRKLKRENAKLRRQVKTLQEKLNEAEKNAKRQTTRFPRRKRKTDKKKPGRKKGSQATHRARPKADREIDVPVDDCPDCCCGLIDVTVHQQLQTDLPPVAPTTTQFNVQVGTCPRCGKRVQGHHPEQISDALGAAGNVIGPNAQTMAAQLKHQAGMSYAKISNFLFDFFDLRTVPSAFVRAGQRFARRAKPTFELLKSQLRQEHVVHADETGWRIGTQSDWLWVFSSQEITIYQVGGGRGHDVPLNILGEDFSEILVSDGLASYDPLPYLKARCAGHILARISKLENQLPERDFWDLLNLKDLFQEAIDLAYRRETLTKTGYRRRVKELENRLDMWLLLNEDHRRPEIARLAGHLQKHRHEWFMFLYDPLVPPTNNHAERMIRPAVIIRKLGGCNKTAAGADVHSVLASLMASCRQQGKRFLDLATELLGSPSLQAIPLAILPDG